MSQNNSKSTKEFVGFSHGSAFTLVMGSLGIAVLLSPLMLLMVVAIEFSLEWLSVRPAERAAHKALCETVAKRVGAGEVDPLAYLQTDCPVRLIDATKIE